MEKVRVGRTHSFCDCSRPTLSYGLQWGEYSRLSISGLLPSSPSDFHLSFPHWAPSFGSQGKNG